MTDKTYKEQKKRVQKCVDKWFKTLGLGWYEVDIVWSRTIDTTSPDCVGRATTSWQYRQAEVVFFLPNVENLSNEKIESIVVHEFTHILTSAISIYIPEGHEQNNEYATECVARALEWAREAGANDAKI